MKKALFYITVAALASQVLAPVASFGQGPPELPEVQLGYSELVRQINRIANFLFAILVVITVIFLIWAAWDYLNGRGDEAKQRIINAAIAIAIGLLARGLPFLVRSLVGQEGYQVPQ